MTKAPLVIRKKWLEVYDYGKGIFYSEYGDDKNVKSSEDNGSHWEEYSSEADGISFTRQK